MSKDTQDRTLLLRGYAVREGSVWTATCLDLTLAAQGDSSEEALQRLTDTVSEYVRQAIGEDHAYKEQLLNRRAPASEYLKYYCIKGLIAVLGWFKQKDRGAGSDNRKSLTSCEKPSPLKVHRSNSLSGTLVVSTVFNPNALVRDIFG